MEDVTKTNDTACRKEMTMLPLYYFEAKIGEEKKAGFVRAARGANDAEAILRSHLGDVKVEKLVVARYRMLDGHRPTMLSRKVAPKGSKPAPAPINDVVASLFESVEPQFRAERVRAYESRANAQYENWMKRLSGEIAPPVQSEGEAHWKFRDRVHNYEAVPEYVLNDRGAWNSAWSSKVADKERWHANLDKAREDANREVDGVKAVFLRKFTDKLNSAVGQRDGLQPLTGSMRMTAGFVAGVLHAVFANGDRFTLEMDVITNFRHESRGAGRFGFYQYPARFKNVQLAGNPPKGKLSEKWMEENFAKGDVQ